MALCDGAEATLVAAAVVGEQVIGVRGGKREDFEAKRAAALAADPMFYQKLAASRRTQLSS